MQIHKQQSHTEPFLTCPQIRRLHMHTASFIEHVAELPKGAVAAATQSLDTTLLGNPTPIRAVLSRPPLSYHEAVQQALLAKMKETASPRK